MKKIEQSIDLAVPAPMAYDQWTQLERFPEFMQHVENVYQVDERHVTWRGRLAFADQRGELEICEQIPGKRIAWKSVSGPTHAGVVTFHRLADDRCRVMVQIEYETEGLVQSTLDVLGRTRQAVVDELANFKKFLEGRGAPTGAWRGTIPSKDDD